VRNSTGADWNSFGHPNSFSLLDAFAMIITLNALETFKVHSKRIPEVTLAGTYTRPMMEKTDPQNRVTFCPTGQNV